MPKKRVRNKCRETSKSMVLLVVLVAVSLVVDLLALNVLYNLGNNSQFRGSLANSDYEDGYYENVVYNVMKDVEGYYDSGGLSDSMQEYYDEAFNLDKPQYPDEIESLIIDKCEANVAAEKEIARVDLYEEYEGRHTTSEFPELEVELLIEYDIQYWMCSGNMEQICMVECYGQAELDLMSCTDSCIGITPRTAFSKCIGDCYLDQDSKEKDCDDECSYYT